MGQCVAKGCGSKPGDIAGREEVMEKRSAVSPKRRKNSFLSRRRKGTKSSVSDATTPEGQSQTLSPKKVATQKMVQDVKTWSESKAVEEEENKADTKTPVTDVIKKPLAKVSADPPLPTATGREDNGKVRNAFAEEAASRRDGGEEKGREEKSGHHTGELLQQRSPKGAEVVGEVPVKGHGDVYEDLSSIAEKEGSIQKQTDDESPKQKPVALVDHEREAMEVQHSKASSMDGGESLRPTLTDPAEQLDREGEHQQPMQQQHDSEWHRDTDTDTNIADDGERLRADSMSASLNPDTKNADDGERLQADSTVASLNPDTNIADDGERLQADSTAASLNPDMDRNNDLVVDHEIPKDDSDALVVGAQTCLEDCATAVDDVDDVAPVPAKSAKSESDRECSEDLSGRAVDDVNNSSRESLSKNSILMHQNSIALTLAEMDLLFGGRSSGQ